MLLWKGLKPSATQGRQRALRPRALAGYQGSGEAGLGAGNNPGRPLWDRKWRLPAPPPPQQAGAPGSPENPERILARYTSGWGRSGALASWRNWVRPPDTLPAGVLASRCARRGMSDSALALLRGLETGIPVPTQRRAAWAPGSPRTVGLETRAPGSRPPSVRRSS